MIFRAIFILLLLYSITEAFLNERTFVTDCSSVYKFQKNLFYQLDERLPLDGYGADFNIDWNTNNLFFTYISNAQRLYLRILLNSTSALRYMTLKTPGTGQTSAIDHRNDIIYLGTDSGIFTYQYSGEIRPYTADGEDVMYVAVNEDSSEMYLAVYPHNTVLRVTNAGRLIEPFPYVGNGHGLKVNSDFIYFLYKDNSESDTEKTPCIYRKSTRTLRKIENIRNLTNVMFDVSTKGVVYAMDFDSNLYTIVSPTNTAVFMGNFGFSGVSAFGTDSYGNILLGKDQEILKFRVYDKDPCLNTNSSKFVDITV